MRDSGGKVSAVPCDAGSEQCSWDRLQISEAQPLDKRLLAELQAAGREAELAANTRWQEVLHQPAPQFPVDPSGSASIKESGQLLADLGAWAPKVTMTTFPNGKLSAPRYFHGLRGKSP